MSELLGPGTGPDLRESHQAQIAAELAHLSELDQAREQVGDNPELASAIEEVFDESEQEITLAARARRWLIEVGKDVGIMVAVNVGGAVARRYGFEPFGLFEDPATTSGMGTSMAVARRGFKKLRERMDTYDQDYEEAGEDTASGPDPDQNAPEGTPR